MAILNLDFYRGNDLYSDGDIENDILSIVKTHKDFVDILHNDNRWPIMYHLSPVRCNLLQWHEFNKMSSLLEIGGGCGALSGLFANKVNQVKVVELSKRRAEIIYNRYMDQNNLEIIVGNLNDIKFNQKFDYITLIGVLEYAAKFTAGDAPYLDFLKTIRSHLATDGQLIIAIENKFGLKYWCGSREDHTGLEFDSIENYPLDKSVQTFSKYELTKLLLDAGFISLDFYYPIPDYKLAQVIYSDHYLPDNTASFATCSPNFDQFRYKLFNENLVYNNLIKNNMFDFFANSFLVMAH